MIKQYSPFEAMKGRNAALGGAERPPRRGAFFRARRKRANSTKPADPAGRLGARLKAAFPRIGPEPGPRNGLGRALFIALDAILILGTLASALFFFTNLWMPDERVSVTLTVDGAQNEYLVFPATVGEFLDECGVTLAKGDTLSCDASAPLEDGMALSIARAYPVVVKSKGGTTLLHMNSGTVGDALRLAGVQYDVHDELSYYAFEGARPGMQIVHTDVEVRYVTSYKTLEYREEIVKDDTMYEEKSEIIQAGMDGKKQITQRVLIKDGVEVSREVVDQVVITPAVNQIKKVGTKIHYQTHLTGEFRRWKAAPVAGKNGWVEMTMDYITAYSGDKKTSTGAKPKLGTIAVNPHYIPYYTEIYVPGYGYGKALDTGAFRNYTRSDGKLVNQLDLFMNTKSECDRWGRKRNVKVLVKLG